MNMDWHIERMLDEGLRAYKEREAKWWKNARSGRWVVLEPGIGRLLKSSPQHVREYVDLITPQRGRRFSSLSHARAFAREIGGEVRRWRKHGYRRYKGRKVKVMWRFETNPWADAGRYGLLSPLFLNEVMFPPSVNDVADHVGCCCSGEVKP